MRLSPRAGMLGCPRRSTLSPRCLHWYQSCRVWLCSCAGFERKASLPCPSDSTSSEEHRHL